MQLLNVGEFKSHFSEVLAEVKLGHSVAIAFGKQKIPIAVIVPYFEYKKPKRALGIFQKKGTATLLPHFKITEEEFLRG
jgi:antitoxin (DNA-binding transcriptional repressor) of toxin-antitoxin stability system